MAIARYTITIHLCIYREITCIPLSIASITETSFTSLELIFYYSSFSIREDEHSLHGIPIFNIVD